MHDILSDRFVRSHLKMRQLVLLVELGRHGSILHAAQAANLTQPAASKLLAELEHALNVQLFERLPRGVLPTWYGEVLIRRAGAALAEMDAAHQEVMELLSGLSGKVNIGAVLTPSAGLLPDAIKLLKTRHARVRVSVTVDTSKLLTDKLRAGELDIVIGRVQDSHAAGELHFEPVTDEPHSLIAGAGHPLATRTGLTLADLAGEPWIVPPAGSVLRDRLTALFLSHGLEPPSDTVEAMALPVIVNLLAGSRMVSALPAELVRPYLDMGLITVLPYDLGLTMDLYGIVTRKQHRLSPGAEAMLATLREVAAQRYPRENG
ncbi:LysR family transcriptional regulator [Pseudoduganella sp. SL102]|uniref:Galactose-binding protein n=1 Tax=Pseudoduganella albidiflava TaxID=321983 RepID=A0A411X5M2_9BURK|nr:MULTISPECIES: LysR family transcriptional regulator [Pseudoduganella]QBI04311.1 LysR family transcriptional regulator [Pseudoduganella albidiflava]WBS03131.1 LysR family transcriptional regulator [Pseudoduganella sp. SL102]GGY26246.1 galactose-binding protein [Pseudoduganella albidiflava]